MEGNPLRFAKQVRFYVAIDIRGSPPVQPASRLLGFLSFASSYAS